MSERERQQRAIWDYVLEEEKVRALTDVLPRLRDRAGEADRSGDWPAFELHMLAHVGAMRWAIPREFGGDDLPPLDLHLRYEQIAAASLAVALVLSQRDSAVGFVAAAEGWARRAKMLTRLASNEWFSTIGIAQLTTSRQGGKPALLARRDGPRWRLSGTIPWATGAALSPFIIAGAATDDGKQILFSLPRDATGVEVGRPMDLVALSATCTATIKLRDVPLETQYVMRGPAEQVLGGRKTVPLPQAFLAMGLCRGAIDLMREHTSHRARQTADRFENQLNSVRDQVLSLCADGREADAAQRAPTVRAHVSELAVRVTHAAVTLYKGSALLHPHPAQRLAREAMFLLVWSCPDPVIESTLDRLRGPSGCAD